MIRPPSLVRGDKAGIVFPARKVSFDELEPAMETIRSWGFTPVAGKPAGEANHQFSGSDEIRAAGLQEMLDNPEIKAVICARGGYGTVRIIDLVDFKSFAASPKWVIGYSDATVLLSHIGRNAGVQTIHAPMPVSFPETDPLSLESLRETLYGKLPEYSTIPHPLNSPGKAEGVLCGGNLSVLYSIMCSSSEPLTSSAILFLEDVDEYLYHVDRMMVGLKRAGRLAQLSGMIIGSFSKMKDNEIPFGKSAFEIVKDHIPQGIPVMFGFPAGHESRNDPLIMGAKVKMDITDERCFLRYL